MSEGSLYDREHRRARDQAGARRPDRGDLPGARLSHHAAALRLRRAARHRRHGAAPPRFRDLQGSARRAGARPDLRLHPSADRLRSRGAGRAGAGGDRAGRPRGARAARHRHHRSRRPDRARDRARGRRAGRRHHPRRADVSRRRAMRGCRTLARGDEGFLLGLAYSTQRGYGRNHPFVGEIRFGEVEVEFFVEDLGFAVPLGEISVTECQMVNQFKGGDGRPAALHPRLRPRLRPERAQGDVDGAGRPRAARRRIRRGAQGARRRTRNSCSRIPTMCRRPASSSI